jgi:hypothetical protein
MLKPPVCCPFCESKNILEVVTNVNEDTEKPWPMFVATDYDGDSETADYGVLYFRCENKHGFYVSDDDQKDDDDDYTT